MHRSGVFLVLAFGLMGCATPTIDCDVKSFSNIEDRHQGATLSVVGNPQATAEDRGFERYKTALEARFAENGFSIVAEPDAADLVAVFTYGINNGEFREDVVSVPVFGEAGGGSLIHTRTVMPHANGQAAHTGAVYTMPTFGVVGPSTSTVTRAVFTRQIAVDVVAQASLDSESPETVYEGRVSSKGRCGLLPEVMDEMIEALFQDFPHSSGRVVITADTNC